MGEETHSLTVFAFATFHVTLLTAGTLLPLHVFADLGVLLAGLDTVTGLSLFLVLWVATWLANGRVMANVPLLTDEWRLRDLVKNAFVWGAFDGVMVLWAIVVIVYLPDATGRITVAALTGAFGVLLFVSAFALVIGGLVGVLLSLLDAALVRVVRASGPEVASGE